MAARIRKGDMVLVTTGKSKGQRGEVLRVFPNADRAIVQDDQGLITNQLDISIPEHDVHSFERLTSASVGGVTLPVFYLLVVALILWYLLEYTPTGRYFYATGSGREAAALAGIRTGRLRFIALLISAGVAGITGIVVASRVVRRIEIRCAPPAGAAWSRRNGAVRHDPGSGPQARPAGAKRCK